jgi:hypothetical protein
MLRGCGISGVLAGSYLWHRRFQFIDTLSDILHSFYVRLSGFDAFSRQPCGSMAPAIEPAHRNEVIQHIDFLCGQENLDGDVVQLLLRRRRARDCWEEAILSCNFLPLDSFFATCGDLF